MAYGAEDANKDFILAREVREEETKAELLVAIKDIKNGDTEAYQVIRNYLLDIFEGWLPAKMWASEDFFDINGDLVNLIDILIGKEV